MTLDVASHCLWVDDAIYRVFVSHNLGSLSAMRDLKSPKFPQCVLISKMFREAFVLRRVMLTLNSFEFSVLAVEHQYSLFDRALDGWYIDKVGTYSSS